MSASGANSVIVWQNGSPGVSCTQYYMSSVDGGKNWTKKRQQFEDLRSCAQDNNFFGADGNMMIFQTKFQNQTYLTAWNGTNWSESQIQRELSGFSDPETLDPVNLGCQEIRYAQPDRLIAVGCDTAGGGDIWASTRNLGANVLDWFPPPSVWNKSTMIYSSSTNIESPVLLADPGSMMHVIWT